MDKSETITVEVLRFYTVYHSKTGVAHVIDLGDIEPSVRGASVSHAIGSGIKERSQDDLSDLKIEGTDKEQDAARADARGRVAEWLGRFYEGMVPNPTGRVFGQSGSAGLSDLFKEMRAVLSLKTGVKQHAKIGKTMGELEAFCKARGYAFEKVRDLAQKRIDDALTLDNLEG